MYRTLRIQTLINSVFSICIMSLISWRVRVNIIYVLVSDEARLIENDGFLIIGARVKYLLIGPRLYEHM